MTSIIEKRISLHKELADQRRQNEALKTELIQLQGLANIGTASHMIAHEINNLLTPLANYAALALRHPEDRSLTEKTLQRTVQNCERATKIMESMLGMVTGCTQRKEQPRLITLVQDVFACLCRDFAKDGITVHIEIPDHLTVWAVPVQIQHVLMNLILNARHAMLPRGGVLTIRAAEAPDVVRIEVTDTGSGIEPADLESIFTSFFTTKKHRSSPSEHPGCGLGLALCKQVIQAHDGCISVESQPGQGSTFRITLPKPQLGGG